MSTTQSPSEYDDPRRPLQRAVRIGALALAVITVLSLVIWGWLRDLPGIWAVLIGAGIGGGFVLLTALSVLLTSGTSPSTTMAVVLGGWLLKIVLLIIVLLFIRDLTFYDNLAMFITVVLALLTTLAAEVWAVITSRVTYVS
ncbi:hypothetical protein NG00_00902 [Corynebacterium camporealensis]|uniref:Uncharacterized protein n=1 Tax=Corynebacterium camporealensis TaxID=161896 RepID=A0A0F6QWH4_9CORY|nr:hypothetical protein [Corynebacterium camporealensis]AKE38965.1 hypothetical protein UL81_04965 [Corynebacterium camporealensis]AVH88208.1 hypothetical protein NG00_00902 [Corynebacterium camporealensis]MDY5839235.1 hypothetical protein [Corynebacterium camporealensis]